MYLDTSYEISIFTGDVSQAGTSASVSIALAGEWDYTKTFTFSSPDRYVIVTIPYFDIDNVSFSGSFDEGKVGTVTVKTDKFLGSLKRVIIGHDNSGIFPGWYVEEVIVTRKEGNDRLTLYYYRMFDCLFSKSDKGLRTLFPARDGLQRMKMTVGQRESCPWQKWWMKSLHL